MQSKRWWSILTVLALVASACTSGAPTTAPGGTSTPGATAPAATAPGATAPAATAPGATEPGETTEPGATEPAATEPAATEPAASAPPAGNAVPTAPTGYTELDAALNGDYTGLRVSIQTQWILGEGANFDAATADFEAATGIDIIQESIASQHEVTLRTRIEGDTPPDLAMLAQPSAVVTYGTRDQTNDVAAFMDASRLETEFPALIPLLTAEGGEIWGIPYKVDVKSTIWYPIIAFESHGYTVPTTWEEMEALAAQIVADGNGSPWCVAISDGAATGWIATDWLEDVMLRTAGIDAYNQWITHDLPFDSPEVRAALEVLAEQWFTEGYVYNGAEAITATDRLEAMDAMFPEDGNWEGFTPGCWMHRQATWFGPDFFPDARAGGPGTVSQYVVGEDIGLMYFPQIDPAHGTPALGAGDTLMVLVDRPEVRAVAQFLSTPQGLQRWIEAGSAISANVTTPAEWYEGSYKLATAAEIVGNATSFGFDASDLMPPVVGGGTFWGGMVNWIEAGGTNTDQVLADIDASWPAP